MNPVIEMGIGRGCACVGVEAGNVAYCAVDFEAKRP